MPKKEKVLCPYYNSCGIICNIQFPFGNNTDCGRDEPSEQKDKEKATVMVAFLFKKS